MWLSISTRPDISNVVRSVARYSSAPKAIHWKAALGILAYINGTSWLGRNNSECFLEVIVDADYASKATDRRSVSGGAIMCADACQCMCIGFPERRYALPFQHLRQNMSLLAMLLNS